MRVSTLRCLTLLAVSACGLALGTAHAQSSCSSDGQPQAVSLLERFINADCDSCWHDPATPKAQAGQVVLDWVLPGSKADDAPLSAVASRDSLKRRNAISMAMPPQSSTRLLNVSRLQGARLRVAHGPVLSGYAGVSIELKPRPPRTEGQGWTASLALVERLPAGTEGSPVARNLVRNVLQLRWDGHKQLSKDEQNRFFESRVMSVAPGARPERLSVVGWVEDDRGQVVGAVMSRCRPEKK